MPPRNWARICFSRRSLFNISNSSSAISSWQKTFTTFCPVMVSSMYPFKAPRADCWPLNYFCLRFATSPPARNMSGIMIRVTAVSQMFV